MSDLRARVFISCGQSKHTDEVQTATAIERRLRELGFDPYVAVQEQSLRGVKENIFEQLGKSEYFIFVDFKREQLANEPSVHRGSLFSHQELAIASYLDIPVIAFQELGVKKDEGIIWFLQTNATTFTDRHLLHSVVADEVGKRQWDPKWRNELVLERNPDQWVDASIRNEDGRCVLVRRFFHIGVRNLHKHKVAQNCYVYLEKAKRLDSGAEMQVSSIEFKWSGYRLPSVNLPPGAVRRFDAFSIQHASTRALEFHTFADSTEFIPRIVGEGQYELTYLVVSENFSPARGSFILSLDTVLEGTHLLCRG